MFFFCFFCRIPRGFSGERCIDGPLEQVVLREFDALDELKDWMEQCDFLLKGAGLLDI